MGEDNPHAIIHLFPKRFSTAVIAADKDHPDYWDASDTFLEKLFLPSKKLDQCRANLWRTISERKLLLVQRRINMTDAYLGVVRAISFQRFLTHPAKTIYICRPPESVDMVVDESMKVCLSFFNDFIKRMRVSKHVKRSDLALVTSFFRELTSVSKGFRSEREVKRSLERKKLKKTADWIEQKSKEDAQKMIGSSEDQISFASLFGGTDERDNQGQAYQEKEKGEGDSGDSEFKELGQESSDEDNSNGDY